MSSSVIVARTRMCRTTVAIMRGGKWCGDWWHRPQFVLNRLSPSASIASLSRTAGAARDFAGAGAALEFDAPVEVAAELAVGLEVEAGVAVEAGAGAAAAATGTAAGTAADVASCPAIAAPQITNAPAANAATPIIWICRLIGYLPDQAAWPAGMSAQASRRSCFRPQARTVCHSCSRIECRHGSSS